MSFAGPISNLLLMICAAVVIKLGILFGQLKMPSSVALTTVVASPTEGVWAGVALLLSMVFSLNLILTILNLLPLPPLDGSAAITIFMSDEMARRFHHFVNQPIFGWIGLIIAWQVFNPILYPIFFTAIGLLYPETQWK